MTTTLPAAPDAAVAEPAVRRRRSGYHLEILLVSVSVLLTEISYTRVISFKLFYYYVYLIIGLALLGLGAGAVLVAVVDRLRKASLDVVLFWSMVLGSGATVGAYCLVAVMQIDTLQVWDYGTAGSVANLALIMATCFCVFISFVGSGVAIAALFARRTEAIGGLYAADLTGAALACVTVVFVISKLGAPATIMLSAAVLAAAALWVGLRIGGRLAAIAARLLTACVVLTVGAGAAPHPAGRYEQALREARQSRHRIGLGTGVPRRCGPRRSPTERAEPLPRRHPRCRDLSMGRDAVPSSRSTTSPRTRARFPSRSSVLRPPTRR